MKHYGFALLLGGSLLTAQTIQADEVTLTFASSAVGTTKQLAIPAGVTATLEWGNSTTTKLVGIGLPQNVNIQHATLKLTTPSRGDLTMLYASNCELENVVFRANQTTALKYLDFSFNNLKSITVNNTLTPALEHVNLRNNKLTALSLPLSSLKTFDAANNQITTLYTSFANSLKSYIASGNVIKSVSIPSAIVTDVWVNDNQLTTFPATNKTRLKTLLAHNNTLSSISGTASLTALTDLWVDRNVLKTLDLSATTALKTLSADSNSLSTITWMANAHNLVKNLYVVGNKLPFSQLPEVSIGAGRRIFINSLIEAQDSFEVATDMNIEETFTIPADFATNANRRRLNTVYTFKKADGTILVQGTDYEVVNATNRTFKFLKGADKVYIAITAPAFYPGVTMVSKSFKVIDPTSAISSVRRNNNNFEITTTKGAIHIHTNKNVEVQIVDMSGRTHIKQVCTVGSSNFSISSGIYLVNGNKVLVP